DEDHALGHLAALEIEYGVHRPAIEGIAAEPPHRFGGIGHHAARANRAGGAAQARGAEPVTGHGSGHRWTGAKWAAEATANAGARQLPGETAAPQRTRMESAPRWSTQRCSASVA